MAVQAHSMDAAQLDFPLQMSRWVGDIQRKNMVLLHSHSTIAEAIDWMAYTCERSVPVMTADTDRPTTTSMRVVEAKALLKTLLQQLSDPALSLADFFAIPLRALPSRRPSIVSAEQDIVSAAGRMYVDRTDVLLVSAGLHLCGIVTTSDIFDVMIGDAVVANSRFQTPPARPGSDAIDDPSRMSCFQQPVSLVYDTTPLHALNGDNRLLTAIRGLLHQPNGHLIVSNGATPCRRLITAPTMLEALWTKFKQSALGAPGDSLIAVLMRPLKEVFDQKTPLLTGDCSLLNALETIHFSNRSCAAVISGAHPCDGVVTSECLLKVFWDSRDTPLAGMS